MTEFKHVLPRIIKVLDTFKKNGLIQGYALIGGMAVAARGFPRATKDIDFLINAEESFFRKELVEQLGAKGYKVKTYKGDFDDPLRGLIRILDGEESPLIDLFLIYTKWQKDIVDSAQEITLGEVSVPVATAQDLIMLKLKAGSARDLLDAEELVKVLSVSGRLDKSRLFSLAKKAGVDKKLERLLSK